MGGTCIAIPCFNEAERLDEAAFLRLSRARDIHLVFVDDGSSDATLEVLHNLASQNRERMDVLSMDENAGKAEAVRQGLLFGLDAGAEVVGFADADLATPVEELLRLSRLCHDGEADALIGSRISFMGTQIERSMKRHYLGRIFATAASMTLKAPIYDTQCGAKFFRSSPLVRSALSSPFHSRWAFDVELLGRLLQAGGLVVEQPLERWADVAGSKITLGSMLKAGIDLVKIRAELRRHGRS